MQIVVSVHKSKTHFQRQGESENFLLLETNGPHERRVLSEKPQTHTNCSQQRQIVASISNAVATPL